MSEPTPPDWEQVYWRRRVAAIGASVLALVLVIWGFGALFSSSHEPGTQNSAQVGDTGWRPPAPNSSASSTAPPSGETAPSSSAAPSSSTAPAPPPKTCDDAQLQLVTIIDKARYTLAEQPEFTMVLTNAGVHPCVKDVDRGIRELIVTDSAGSHVWSSGDCYFDASAKEPRTLRPGQQASFGLHWLGVRSTPQCSGDRAHIEPGKYRVSARIGKLASAPVNFTVTR